MKLFETAFRLAGAALGSFVLSSLMLAQGLEPTTLLKPPPDSWPGYHGDYSGKRHSPLTQITPQNVQYTGSRVGFSDRHWRHAEIFSAAG